MNQPARRGLRRADAERNDHALLQAARDVLAEDGAKASVAAIAARAGVGIGSLYRRFRTKEELFQRLSMLSLDRWIHAAEQGLRDSDPWTGLADFITACVESGPGLAAAAGTIAVTDEMNDKSRRGDQLLVALVDRAHRAGMLRPDITAIDISLLIEQLATSPLIEQLRRQGHDKLLPAATDARRRLIAVALDGLRPGQTPPLPGNPPSDRLFTERWAATDKQPKASRGSQPPRG
jgi:AcrR family transcriptional regulator